MNNSSPFQPAAEEGFTIRELSMLLPPQLLKSEGLPPDYLVPLPIQSLYASFQAGRPCLRLSQICQSAPYLFNRQLLHGEDQEVALPYQKVRRILETAGMPVAAPTSNLPEPVQPPKVESPFSVSPGDPLLDRNSHSPFQPANSPETLRPIDSPFQINQPTAPASPFLAMDQSPFKPAFPAGPPPAAPSHLPPPRMENTPIPASPFQVVPSGHGTFAPGSPFSISQRLPLSEAPPAYPAPVSSSPFQVAPTQPILPPLTPAPPLPPLEPSPTRAFTPPILVRSEPPQSSAPTHFTQPSLPAAPIAVEQAPQSEPLPSQITLRLRSVLSAAPVTALGFDPVNVPDAVSVQFPLELISSQLATGKVTVKLADLVNGVSEKFRPAFSRAQIDLVLDLPLTDLLHALPTGMVQQPTAPVAEETPKFITPFQAPAAEDATRIPAPPAPVQLPPLLRPTQQQRQVEPSFTPIPLSQLAVHEDLGQPRDPESLTAAPPEHLPLRGIPSPTTSEIDLPQITAPIGLLPPAPQLSAIPQEPARPPEMAAPSPVPPAPNSECQDLQFGYQERAELLALRHLLDCPPGVTPEQLIDKVATLPGIKAAVLINAQGQQNGGDASAVPAAFFDSAVHAWNSLKMLAESMGMPPEGSFTLRADQMVRTFFLDGSICMAVLHVQPEFASGIRDKLILATREVARLCA